MSRLLLALGAAVAAALLAVPLGAALLLTAISTPAVAHTIDCAPTVVATAPATPPPSMPSTPPVTGPSAPGPAEGGLEEGGLGFDLPPAGGPRGMSLSVAAAPIPARTEQLYRDAGRDYRLPWTLLAGIGMAQTRHGRTPATTGTGPMGVPAALFTAHATDGDGDGHAEATSAADSAATTAVALLATGVTAGPHGLRAALDQWRHADTWVNDVWVNDVLAYAHAYGGGTVLGDVTDCGAGGTGNPDLPPLTSDRAGAVLAWAASHVGDTYRMGAVGPHAWDCSSFSQNAFAEIGIRMPRTAEAQRNWLAAGNGFPVAAGSEQPGDLIFWDSYLGPHRIGHVMIVWDPATQRTVEAHGRASGVGHFSYAAGPGHHIFEIWRIGDLTSS
jgi:cell wall-associated NlpC family hydrolase